MTYDPHVQTGAFEWRLAEVLLQWNRAHPQDRRTMTSLARRIGTYPNRLTALVHHAPPVVDLRLLNMLCTVVQCRPSDLLVPVPDLPEMPRTDDTTISQPLTISATVFGANLTQLLRNHKATLNARAIERQLGTGRNVMMNWKQGKVHLLNRQWLWQLSVLFTVPTIDWWFVDTPSLAQSPSG